MWTRAICVKFAYLEIVTLVLASYIKIYAFVLQVCICICFFGDCTKKIWIMIWKLYLIAVCIFKDVVVFVFVFAVNVRDHHSVETEFDCCVHIYKYICIFICIG